MITREGISKHTQNLLKRPGGSQVHFSDVVPEVTTSNDMGWWREADFDADLTIGMESTGSFPDLTTIPIGERPWVASYGLTLVDDLVQTRAERLDGINASDTTLHPDILTESRQAERAAIALGNYAPRNKEHSANNGSNFFLAITESGLEIYATPVNLLQGLDVRDRIIALYEIPNEDHPEYDGEHEQFRSARVTRTRRHPGHLRPIFEYSDRAALIAAKEAGTHPVNAIPLDRRIGHVAFIDKFGNNKLELQDKGGLPISRKTDTSATLKVDTGNRTYEFDVAVAADLRSAPLGRLAVWNNCSDQADSPRVGFVELGVRVDDNPSTSLDTAAYKLYETMPDFDPATAEVQLVNSVRH
jgi:hypothetical protein